MIKLPYSSSMLVTSWIPSSSIEAATTVVTWHLGEACRLLGTLEESPLLAATIRLDVCLRAEAQCTQASRVPTRRIFQYWPRTVRDIAMFEASMVLLTERGRPRLEGDGRKRNVAINPALLDDDGV